MTNPPKKIITPATLASLRQRFFRAQNSQHTALRCQPAPLRIPSRFPPAAPPHPPGKPPFLLIRFPLPSVARLRGALLGGQRSRSACSARSSRSPLAPLSLAPLAGASGWRLVLLLRRVVTVLLVAPFGRTPPLRFALAVVAAARLAARRSCAVGRLRSLPAGRSSPRPGLRRLPLRGCAPCPHRRLGLEAASVTLSSGGAAAWLVRRSFYVAAPAWRALCCCASSSSFVPGSAALFPPSPRRRRRYAFRRRRGCPAARRCRWPLAFLRSASVAL